MQQFLGNPVLDILLIIVLSVVPTFIILAIVFGAIHAADKRTQKLLAEGEPAEATVIDVRYTGVKINSRPQVAVDMDVQRPGYPPYRATAKILINRSASLFAPSNVHPPGTRLAVRVDREKPQHVAIVGPIGGNASVGTLSNTQVFVVDGQTYHSSDDLPAHAREALERANAMLGDRDGDGMPDIFNNTAATATRSPADRLAELQRMHDQGLISTSEYEAKKAQILAQL